MSAEASIQLVPMSAAQLREIAAGAAVSIPGLAVAEGALPPPQVALRVLRRLELGCAAEWVLPLMIVDAQSRTIVGGCTFKGLSVSGCVEIGYGIAPSRQRRGYASAAVRQLLDRAAASGQVREVFALIAPDNAASASVVAGAGFAEGPCIIDEDGERVVRWTFRCTAPLG